MADFTSDQLWEAMAALLSSVDDADGRRLLKAWSKQPANIATETYVATQIVAGLALEAGPDARDLYLATFYAIVVAHVKERTQCSVN